MAVGTISKAARDAGLVSASLVGSAGFAIAPLASSGKTSNAPSVTGGVPPGGATPVGATPITSNDPTSLTAAHVACAASALTHFSSPPDAGAGIVNATLGRSA